MLALEPCSSCATPAGWRCAACGPKCTAHVRRVPSKALRFRCAVCGADATLLRVPRSQVVDFRGLVKPALQHPTGGRQLFALVLSVLAFWSVVVLGVAGFVLAAVVSLVLATAFLRARASGGEFDWPSPSTFADEVGAPLGRMLTGLAPFLLTMAVAYQLAVWQPWRVEATHRWSLEAALLLSPAMWLLLVATHLLFPVIGLAALVAPSPAAALDVREWWKIGRAHVRSLRWVAAFLGGGTLLALVIRVVFPGGVGGLLSALAFSWGLLSAFGLLGDFLYVHASEVGWGRADESLVDAGDPQAPEVEAGKPAPVATAHMQSSLAAQLASALDAKNAKLAVQLYSADPALSDSTLPAALLLRVGQASASVDDLPHAIRALTAAGQHAEPDGGKALVIAARIFEERLREMERARTLYESVVQRFPGSQAASYAAQQLADQRFAIRPR